jgi:hypothetical protein
LSRLGWNICLGGFGNLHADCTPDVAAGRLVWNTAFLAVHWIVAFTLS